MIGIIIILLAVCICLGIFLLKTKQDVNKINSEIDLQNKELENHNEKLKQETQTLEIQKNVNYNELQLIEKQIRDKKNEVTQQIDDFYNSQIALIQKQLELDRTQLDSSFSQYQHEIDIKKEKCYNDFISFENETKENIATIQSNLDKMKAAQTLTLQRIKKEQELKEQQDFYRVIIEESDEHDIQTLEEIKAKLKRSDILDKLIWTTFYQKPTTAMVNNVVGINTICGIYKITGINSQMIYIGQSVDIGERFKQHIKAALGASPAPANKLYSHMRKEKVENFTFEILERCERAELNDREKYWINYYNSDVYGLNGTKGNMTK